MKTTPTFTASIFVGLREGYSETVFNIETVRALLRRYVDRVGFCVSVTETSFIYKNGQEPGVIVGVINYPRLPLDGAVLYDRALEIASLLKRELRQLRVSIVFQAETVMLGEDDV